MPDRVEHHAHAVVGLMIRQPGSQLDRPGDALVQIVDRDVEVHHHLLRAVLGRPHGRDEVLFDLERQSRADTGGRSWTQPGSSVILIQPSSCS